MVCTNVFCFVWCSSPKNVASTIHCAFGAVAIKGTIIVLIIPLNVLDPGLVPEFSSVLGILPAI